MKKILIVRPDALGDSVLMGPMISAIKSGSPSVEISVLCSPATAPFFDAHPDVSNYILDWKKQGKIHGISDFWRYIQFLKGKKFDVVVLAYSSGFYAWLTFLAGIPVRIGDKNRILLRPIFSHAVAQPIRNLMLHIVEQNAVWLPAILGKAIPQLKHPKYKLSESAKQTVSQKLKDLSAKKLIGIHPGSGGNTRLWPVERYAELINRIHREFPYQVVLTGAGKDEEERASKIVALCERKPFSLANALTLPELMALLQRFEAYIGSDTGPTHLAAALGTRVLSLSFSKFSKALHWGPWGTKNRAVGMSRACRYRCFPLTCRRPDCLEALNVSHVMDALNELLNDHSAVDLSRDRQQWFMVNATVVIYSDLEGQASEVKVLADTLLTAGVNTLIVTPSIRCSNQFASYAVETIPRWDWMSWIRLLVTRDVTVIHTVAYRHPAFGILTRLAAPGQYVPAIVIQGSTNGNYSEVFSRYAAAFNETRS